MCGIIILYFYACKSVPSRGVGVYFIAKLIEVREMQTQVFDRDGFKSFREELLARRDKTDIVASTGAMHMDKDGTFAIETKDGGYYNLTPNSWAHNQLSQFTDIPYKYYSRMKAVDTGLLAENVNKWLGEKDVPRLIRSFNKEMIAFLSDRYHRIDNYEVAQWALEGALMSSPNVQVFRSYVTDKEMRMTIWDPSEQIQLPSDPKDVYYPALSVENSEVGAHSYNVRGMIVRGACSNGLILIGGFDYSRRHIGKRLEEGDNSIWSNETLKIQAELIKSQTADVARSSFDRSNILFELAKLDKLRTEPMKATLQLSTAQVLGLTEDENGSVWDRMEQNNKYEFVQAVTNLATEYYDKNRNPERGTELEELGGRLAAGQFWDDIEAESKKKKNGGL